VNRIALHQSTVHPLDPLALVEVAQGARIDSIGLRVAAVDEVQQWWGKGIGSQMLHDLVPALLSSRVTVLDVGRVVLGPELHTVDSRHAYTRALELGTRLGAQFVTARAAAGSTEDQAELFGLLAALAAPYRLRPLITVVPGSPVDSIGRALDVVAGTTGGVVLDVSPQRHTAADVDEAVVELGDALGYIRVPARELEGRRAPGLLATLPPQVAVAIGATATGDPEPGAVVRDDHVARISTLRAAVDEMLRHPRAADAR
jgi:hypothetical protein